MFLVGVILITGFFSFGHVLQVQAQTTVNDRLGLTQVASGTGLGTEDLRVTIAKIIRAILGFLGIAALCVMIYGGYVYMTAGGNEQRVSTAKKIMINGTIGLAIIFSSFAITQFVLNKLAEATNFAGAGTIPVGCADPIYAAANPAICNPGFNPCDNLDNQFVVKSITPNTPAASTGMNNFAVRVIFSQPVAGANADSVFNITRGGADVDNEFSFSYIDGNTSIVEARSSGAPAGTFAQGSYTVTVLSTLTSTGGLNLETGNACGSFPSSASFNATTGVDSQAPTVGAITYNGLNYGGAIALPRGRTYRIGAAIQDNSGAGYVHLQVQRYNTATNAAIGGPVVYYDGPRTTRGSQATATDPYNFSYNYLVSELTPLYNDPSGQNSYFRVTLAATDIDHNSTTVTSDFVVVENVCAFGTGEGADIGCRGNGSCVGNSDCVSGVCNTTTGQCVNVPLIADISPWSQSGGSWVTVMGNGFGSTQGTVQFGRDTNADGNPDAWVPATVVSCNGSDVWYDNYVIVETPADDLALPDLSLSSVRVNHALYVSDPVANPDFFDESTNNRGPLGGPDMGWFTKDNSLSLPGLCGINPVNGLPLTDVSVFGQKLGTGGVGSSISFGGVAGPIRAWLANGTQIDSTIPDNMSPGYVGVVATIGGQQSNGVPFLVLSEAQVNAPVIESVTPSDITADSYITISGKRFGNNPGIIYLSPNTTTNCPNAACVTLETTLPAACGDTWNDEQIIAQVPATAPTGQRVVIVENSFALQSIPGIADRLNIISGGPMPSICALSPTKGMAPLEAGHPGINITGINFSVGPRVYFWGQQSVINNNATWLSLLGSPVTTSGLETITINIPVDYNGLPISSNPLPTPGGSGFSMASGPIKIMSGAGQESNSVKYSVDDCRTVAQNRWPVSMRCCVEGPSAGNFIHNSFACPGETRTGGYVWRFTAGRIADLPMVVEDCSTLISPTPWRQQGNGNNICLNAMISADFTMSMDVASFAGNVRLFTMGTGDQPDTGSLDNISTQVAALPATPPNTITRFTIRNSGAPSNLMPNTWYRVVLLNGIRSYESILVLGNPTIFNRNLLRTRPCNIDLDGNGSDDKDLTAYCFDFKTGPAGSECLLQNVSVKPDIFNVATLGPVINRQTAEDLVYEVWGRGDQECSMITVAGMGWNWGAFDIPSLTPEPLASADAIGQGPGLTDNLATAIALREPQAPNTHTRILASAVYNGNNVSGSSNLYIALGPPKITEYWPNCAAACINATLGAKFNRMMDPSTYAGNIRLYQCPSENACILAIANNSVAGLTPVAVNILPEYIANRYEVQFVPAANLSQNTSYVVHFTNGIYSVGQVDSNNNIVRQGDRLEEKMWQFKTKQDGGFCIAEKVSTKPDPFTAYFIGEKTRYVSSPFTNPDQCSSSGQSLNPWGFGWSWSTVTPVVATISNFATAGQVKSFCNAGCLPKGSDVVTGGTIIGLCGNGTKEPGEDCDIGSVGETVNVSCSLSCQRPGNLTASCGNNVLEINLGEECDKGLTSVTRIGCADDCTNGGSTTNPAQASTGQSLCGSGGLPTVGEDCEPGLNGEIAGVTCLENCLHVGTRMSQIWCDNNVVAYGNSNECKIALSACGNNMIESGEECEVIGGNVVVRRTAGGNFTSDAPVASCSNNCLLQNVCGTNLLVPANNVELTCDYSAVNNEGCNPDCTLHGSSVNEYAVSSLCGDSVDGVGEFSQCEYTPAELSAFGISDQNPVQVVTSIGNGVLNPTTQGQDTQIISSIVSVRDPQQNLSAAQIAQLTSNSDYSLQCGFTEFTTNIVPFNDCHDGNNGLTQGAGSNSCCYTRPHMISNYPLDAAGFSTTATCRNTAIFARFNGDIDEATLANNFILAKGYATNLGTECGSLDKNITASVRATLAFAGQNSSVENSGGIWNNIWNNLKNIFALAVDKVKASSVTNAASGINTWCKTDLTGVPEVFKVKDADGNVVESIANAYLSDLLEENTTYAVFLRGGKTGIKDTKGVGINNIAVTRLDDSFVFRTGDEVCKIDKVSIDPASYVFTTPNSQKTPTNTFIASVKTINDQLIWPINGFYGWDWNWGPVNDPIFNIPQNPPGLTHINVISSTNLEGHRVGHGVLSVTVDTSSQDNQLGQIFVADTDLTSIFCEHPWPSVATYPYEDMTGNNDGTDGAGVFNGSSIPAVGGNYFNFRTGYCADDGQQADQSDDLPYLRPFVFTANFPDPDTLKKFLFFNDINNDAIGIQVFRNSNRESVSDWFRHRIADPIPPMFKAITIDGYDALTDGSNYYIDALNIVGTNAYNNIFLISINKDAKDNTKKVFDQFIGALEFNSNFTDNGYCSLTPTKLCTNNYDCADENGVAVDGICDANKTKMRRDWQRIVAVAGIQSQLRGFTADNTLPAPALASGTYLPGETKSLWPSWGNLGSQIGRVGTDPLNRWTSCSYCSNDTSSPLTLCSTDEDCGVGNTCITVDSQTCWDDVNNRFICPRMSNVISYAKGSGNNYTVYAPLEYFSNVSGFAGLDTAHYSANDPRCAVAGTYVDPSAGACGNGILNTGEGCEPPGQVIVTQTVCNVAPGTGNGRVSALCSATCTVTSNFCELVTTCGNGRKEPGETCDEGRLLNGTYGHCNNTCSGVSSQYCGNSTVDRHCSNNATVTCAANATCTALTPSDPYATCVASEFCEGGAANGNYASGCAADCQSTGPRCGDGIIQTAATGTPGASEECDDGNINSGDGCRSNCTSEPVVTPPIGDTVPESCGDGIINGTETCDKGNDPLRGNGIACVPEYGKTCDYCAYDCSKVLYIEPIGFCGNRLIDVTEISPIGLQTYEDCEFMPRECGTSGCVGPSIQHGVPQGGPPPIATITPVNSCNYSSWTIQEKTFITQTGEYKCLDSCSRYVTDCNTCGNALEGSGGTIARVAIVNPMIGADVSTHTWFADHLFAKFYMRKTNTTSGAYVVDADSSAVVDAGVAGSPKDVYSLPTYGVSDQQASPKNIRGIVSDPVCDGIYYMCFNDSTIAPGNCLSTNVPSTYLWSFPVKGESTFVDNEYVVAPNPPVGTVRVVIKWTDQDRNLLSNGKFGLGVINSATGAKAGSITYFSPGVSMCTDINPVADNTGATHWWPFGCSNWRPGVTENTGVYMHQSFNAPHTYTQAMTIDLWNPGTDPNYDEYILSGPFAIFAEAHTGLSSPNNGIPMSGLLRSEAEVLVFEHHAIPPGGTFDTVFPPDYTFKLKDAQRSSVPGARYWHIFNIRRDDDSNPLAVPPTNGTYYGYSIDSAQKIRSDAASLVIGAQNPILE